MNSLLEKNLISSREASEKSGYNSDYLARLCREGKIEGTQVGRTWLLSQTSLDAFVKSQDERKKEFAHELSQHREKEYRVSQAPITRVTRATTSQVRNLTSRVSIPSGLRGTEFEKRGVALMVTLAVLLIGVAGTQIGAVQYAGNHAMATSLTIASGLRSITSNAYAAAENSTVLAVAQAQRQSLFAMSASAASVPIASAATLTTAYPLAVSSLASDASTTATSSARSFASAQSPASAVPTDATAANATIVPLAVSSELISHPSRIPFAFAAGAMHAYVAVGANTYNAIQGGLAAYANGLATSGDVALAAGSMLRDTSYTLPLAFARVEVGAVLSAAHATQRVSDALLNGYARSVYAFVDNASGVPETITTGAYVTGTTLADGAALLPNMLMHGYPVTMQRTGMLAYARVVSGAGSLADAALPAVPGAPEIHVPAPRIAARAGVQVAAAAQQTLAVLETTSTSSTAQDQTDAVLGALGNSVLALNSAPGNLSAAVESAIRLTFGEKFALATYEAIHNFFSHTQKIFAFLLGDRSATTLSPMLVIVPNATRPMPVAGSPTVTIGSSVTHTTTATTGNTTIVVNQDSPVLPAGNWATQSYVDSQLSSLRAETLRQIEAALFPAGGNGGGGGGSSNSTPAVSGGAINGTSLTINGNGSLTGDLDVGGTLTSTNLSLSTLTTSGTATVGGLSVGSLDGFLKATAGAISTSFIDLTSDVTGVLPVVSGGTGSSSFATNGVLYGNGTNNLLTTGEGATNTVLVANNGAPSFSSAITVGTSVTTPVVNANTITTGTFTATSTASLASLGGAAFSSLSDGYLPKWNATDGTFGNSLLYDNSTQIGIGTNSNLNGALTLNGPIGTQAQGDIFREYDSGDAAWYPVIARYDTVSGFPGGTYLFGSGANANVGIEVPGGGDVNSFHVKATVSTFDNAVQVSGPLTLSGVTSCTGGSSVLQTDSSGNVTCGVISVSGASTGGGWTTDNSASVFLATTTYNVAIGASSTPYAKLSIISGSAASTTLALLPASGQTANILDIYTTSGKLSSVFTAGGSFGIGTTSPSAKLAVQGNGLFSGDLSVANFVATGTATIGGTATVGNLINTGVSANKLLYVNGSQQVSAVTLSSPLTFTTGTFAITQASGSQDGYLTSADWTTFNNKQNALTFGNLTVGSGLSVSGGTGAVIGSGAVVSLGTVPIANGGTGTTTGGVIGGIGYYDGSTLTNGYGLVYTAGNVGIGTTSPFAKLSVAGSLALTGALYDANSSAGGNGYILQSTGSGTQWVATTTLGYSSLASFSATAPLAYNNTTGAFSITQAGSLGDGYLSSTDWNTFNNKQNALTFGNLTVGSGLSVTGGTGAVIGSGAVVSLGTVGIANGGTGTTTGGVTNGVEYYNGSTLTNNANLKFNGTTLTANVLTVTNDATINGITVGKGGGAVNLNTAIGGGALAANTTGTENTAVGFAALYGNGSFNTSIGFESLYSNMTGGSNTAVGTGALYSNITGNNNAAIGVNALYSNISATSSTAFGYKAAFGPTFSYSNQGGTYFGYQSGYSAGNSSDYNTFLGYQSGYNNTTGFDNILIGPTLNTGGNNITTGGNNVGLGFNAVFPSATANNQLNIGNSIFGTLVATSSATSVPTNFSAVRLGIGTSSPQSMFAVGGNASIGADYNIAAPTNGLLVEGNVGIGTTSPFAKLSVAGSLALTGAFYDKNSSAGGNGYVLQTTGSGTQWVATSTLGYPTLSSFSATAPLAYNNTTGAFSITQAGSLGDGYLSSTDWNTFNNKQNALTFGDLTVGTGLSVTGGTGAVIGSGAVVSLGTVGIANGGTGTTTGGVTNGVEYYNGTNLTNNANLTFNGSLLNLTGNASTTQLTTTGNTYLATAGGNVGIGTTLPSATLSVAGTGYFSSALTAASTFTAGNYTTSFIGGTSVWTDRTGSSSRTWQSITSSSDGTKLAAAILNGHIYTSTDSGATWTDQTAAGSRNWRGITSSSDGTKLAAAALGGDIYTSTDSGATWTDQTAAGSRNWLAITSSSDGTKLAAAVSSGDIYTSTDSGATWTDRTAAGSHSWQSITSSSDGTKLAAAILNGHIYTSTDSGATWTDRTAAGSRQWSSITSSSDGTKLAAVVGPGDIYTSTDSGATWTDRTAAGSHVWTSITSSSDGTKLAAAVSSGDIYTSTDSGATWTDQTAAGSRTWRGITSSSDGTKLAAAGASTDIWTYAPAAVSLGQTAFSVSSSGNVGIGTSSPYAMLSISGTPAATTPLFAVSTSTNAFATSTALTIDSNGNLLAGLSGARVGIGTTTPLSLLTVGGGATIGADYNIAAPTNGLLVEGNVGIGTTSPFATLSVTGSLALTGAFYDKNASAGTNGYVLQTTGSSTQWVATSTLGYPTLSSFSASAPLAYNNTTGAFSITQAGSLGDGYLSSTDWNTFNNKQNALTFSAPLVNTSNTISLGTVGIANGGTGTTTGGVTNGVEYYNGTNLTNSANLTFNGSLLNLTGNASTTQLTTTGNTYLATAGGNVGIGTTLPSATLSVAGTGYFSSALTAASTFTAGNYTASVIGNTNVWTDQTAAGSRRWESITSSSDGTHLAAVVSGGDIYTSTDSGATWTDQTAAGSLSWYSITSSSDGTKLAAVTHGAYIYTSTDSGVTWSTQSNSSGAHSWQAITSSSDGTHLAAVVSGGDIYTSTDSGATWTDRTAAGSRQWSSITSSSDGTKLAAGSFFGDIYTSTDSGATWTDRTAAGSRQWSSITSSSDGTHVAAGAAGGDIYTSTDSGATWTDRTPSGALHGLNWQAITSSSDGTKLAAGSFFGDIYTSTDSGATWTDQTAAGSREWLSITSSSDGTKLAAGDESSAGNIWTYAPLVSAYAQSAFSVAASHNVGIGTSSPYAMLSISGTPAATTPLFAVSTSTNAFATSTALTIDSKGNLLAGLSGAHVGIGTTTPLSLLTVGGGATIGADYNIAAPANGLLVEGNVGIGTTTPWGRLTVDTSNLAAGTPEFVIGSSTRTDFIVGQNGNIGIGSSTPNSLLSIGNTNGINFSTATSTFYSTGGINLTSGCFAINGTCVGGGGGSFSNTLANGGTGTTTFSVGGVVFSDGTKLTQAAGSGSNIFTWDNTNGRLGIGTSSPWKSLSVAGSFSLTGALYDSTASAGTNGYILQTTGTGVQWVATSTLGLGGGGGGSGTVGSGTQGWVPFYNAAGTTLTATSSLFIAQSGNIGIGTTNPLALLTVNGLASTTNLTVSGIANGSAQCLQINGSGLVSGTGSACGGSGSSPGGSDGQVQFNSGGTFAGAANLYWVSSTNRLGIGTSSPVAPLSVSAAGSAAKFKTTTDTASALSVENAAGANVFQVDTLNSSANIFEVGTSTGTAYFDITSGGNVGIGTTSPTALLGIQGAIGVSSSQLYLAANGNVGINTATPGSALAVGGGATIGADYGGAAPTNGLLVEGNIGINTTSITTTNRLTVNGASNDTGIIVTGVSGGTGLNLNSITNGTVISATGLNSGIGINATSLSTGRVINATPTTSGIGLNFNTTSASLTIASALTITGNANMTSDYTGAFINAIPTRNVSAAATRTHSGNIVNISPTYSTSGSSNSILNLTGTTTQLSRTISNASSGASAAINVTAPVVGITNLVGTATGVVDSSNVLSILQMAAGSTGTVLALNNAGSGNLATFTGNGNFGIGTSSPATKLDVNGDITDEAQKSCTGLQTDANGKIICTASDQRLKTDITPLSGSTQMGTNGDALAALNQLQPVSFNWKDQSRGSNLQYGFIAQEVAQVFPNLVNTIAPTPLTPDGTYSLNYDGLIAPAISAIQELDTRTKFISNTASTTALTVDPSGRVSFTAASTGKLTVTGNITADGTLSSASVATGAVNATGTISAGNFTVLSISSSTPAAVLNAAGTGISFANFANYTFNQLNVQASNTASITNQVTSLANRVSSLEAFQSQISTSSLAAVISGANANSTSSVLSDATTTVMNALQDMGVLVQKGIAQFNTLVVRDLVFSKDGDGTSAAGSGTISSGSLSVEINSDHMLASSQVSVTLTSPLNGNWYVSNKKDGSFTIYLSQTQGQEVTFDYLIVQTQGQIATSTPIGPANQGSFSFSSWLASLFGGSATSSNNSSSNSSTGTANSSGTTSSSDSDVNSESNSDASSTVSASAPVVTLKGGAAISLSIGDVFLDPGATAVDASSTDISSSIEVSGTVDANTAGMYTLTYTATDAAGNTGAASRLVTISAGTSAQSSTGSGSTGSNTPSTVGSDNTSAGGTAASSSPAASPGG